jgi:hypothetical protein
MKRLTFNDGSGNLTVREFATMRDGSTLVKVSNPQGQLIWVDAERLEVIDYD